MLYPTLEDGHQVLGEDYCSGYADDAGLWNTGFYCPSLIPDVKVFCCGTQVIQYCCTIGKQIPGGHYSKGYDIQQPTNSGYEEDTETPYEEDSTDLIPSENPSTAEEPFPDITFVVAAISGLIAIAGFMTVVSCLYCSCCLLYKKRRRLDPLLYGGIQPSSTSCGLLNSLNTMPSTGATNNLSRNHDIVVVGGTTISGSMPNYVVSTNRLNPLNDYWNERHSNSSGNTTSGSSQSGGVAPVDASILHFNINESSDGVQFPRRNFAHLEPPPPYVATVGQASGHTESIASGPRVLSSRTPQRSNSANNHRNLLDNNINSRLTSETIRQANIPSESSESSIPPPNALTRLLSSANRGRSNLPPPYFVEQYRIRNRVRLPPGETSSRQNVQNLLYPLLNNAPGTNRRQRSTDTQSEPRRTHHRHSPSGNIPLHRSSSDRQQNGINVSRETSRRTIPRSSRSETQCGRDVNRMMLLENMHKILNTAQAHQPRTSWRPRLSLEQQHHPTPSTSAQGPMTSDSPFHTTAPQPTRNEPGERRETSIEIIRTVNSLQNNSEDEEDEIIAVVTTLPIHQNLERDTSGQDYDDLEYDENSGENSPAKLSESAPNSSGHGSEPRSQYIGEKVLSNSGNSSDNNNTEHEF